MASLNVDSAPSFPVAAKREDLVGPYNLRLKKKLHWMAGKLGGMNDSVSICNWAHSMTLIKNLLLTPPLNHTHKHHLHTKPSVSLTLSEASCILNCPPTMPAMSINSAASSTNLLPSPTPKHTTKAEILSPLSQVTARPGDCDRGLVEPSSSFTSTNKKSPIPKETPINSRTSGLNIEPSWRAPDHSSTNYQPDVHSSNSKTPVTIRRNTCSKLRKRPPQVCLEPRYQEMSDSVTAVLPTNPNWQKQWQQLLHDSRAANLPWGEVINLNRWKYPRVTDYLIKMQDNLPWGEVIKP